MGILGNTSIEGYLIDMEKDICEANSADHKPTYQDEVNHTKKRCMELYDEGKKLIAEIDEEDLNRCRRLYRHEKGDHYRENNLVESKVLGTRVIVPVHVTLIERVASLKEILA